MGPISSTSAVRNSGYEGTLARRQAFSLGKMLHFVSHFAVEHA